MNQHYWLYDIVVNGAGEIVAMCFHEGGARDCLLEKAASLVMEGLELQVSRTFDTLDEAKADAWKRKEQFSKGLD